MEFFAGARVVRLQSIRSKYLVAEDNGKHVSQHRDGSSARARWTVEVITDPIEKPRLRLKSCYGRYLAASFTKRAFLRLTGKVFLEPPNCLSNRVEWQPLREGFHVLLRCFFHVHLRAGWRNSVTVNTPSWRCTEDSFLWDVEILERKEQLPLPPPSSLTEEPSLRFYVQLASDDASSSMAAKQSFSFEVSSFPKCRNSSSSSSMAAKQSFSFEVSSFPKCRNSSSSSSMVAIPSSPSNAAVPLLCSPRCYTDDNELEPFALSSSKMEVGNQTIHYVVADDSGNLDEENGKRTLTFAGRSISKLTSIMEEETGLDNISLYARSMLSHRLVPLQRWLPSSYLYSHLVVVFNANPKGSRERRLRGLFRGDCANNNKDISDSSEVDEADGNAEQQ